MAYKLASGLEELEMQAQLRPVGEDFKQYIKSPTTAIETKRYASEQTKTSLTRLRQRNVT